MSEEIKVVEKTEKSNVLIENLGNLLSGDGLQKYVLGTKKNGTPRAVYDIIKDYNKPKKKKGKKKNKKNKNNEIPASYSLYLNTKDFKKKKKKNKKKDKYWHI